MEHALVDTKSFAQDFLPQTLYVGETNEQHSVDKRGDLSSPFVLKRRIMSVSDESEVVARFESQDLYLKYLIRALHIHSNHSSIHLSKNVNFHS